MLAAGAASRMGEQKMLLPFAGMTVVERVVQELAAGGVGEILVVTGADAPTVEAAVRRCGVSTVRNTEFARGMLSSVREGLSAAPAHWTAAVIALGDQPLITRDIVRAVLNAHALRPDAIALPVFERRRGHPMVLPRAFWDEVLTKHDDVGLRGLLRASGVVVQDVAVDTADVLSDMDTPEDYRRAIARLVERDGASPA